MLIQSEARMTITEQGQQHIKARSGMMTRERTTTLYRQARQLRVRLVLQYVLVFLVVMITTLVLFAFRQDIEDTKLSLFYLLIVLCCAVVAHPGVTFFCGILSFLSYDFFLVPPVFTLRFATPIQALDPLAFLIVAIVAGTIAERARQHADEKIVYQKADQLRGTLLHLVSHNLRTPLSTIKTVLTTLLTQDEMNPESKQLLEYANQEVDHLNRLIANVLQISRLEADAIRINERWDVLDELVGTVLSRWPEALA